MTRTYHTNRKKILTSRGGATPLYKPYRYVPPHQVMFLCHYRLKMGIKFAHFGLESGMVFEVTM